MPATTRSSISCAPCEDSLPGFPVVFLLCLSVLVFFVSLLFFVSYVFGIFRA
ncbi:hypothetical protein LptCag_1540 [Leptospirillum ferriphilum]|uniref:Uncharacterized protein n=1 Tax=Leptospirillum ferriphilum TaxID=178606 RepID=A0A094WBE8_9BACT|nr:hypothetical protein LptCag_1540 [Leptospirillum ferriphilum]